jgi:hypothetical protein
VSVVTCRSDPLFSTRVCRSSGNVAISIQMTNA